MNERGVMAYRAFDKLCRHPRRGGPQIICPNTGGGGQPRRCPRSLLTELSDFFFGKLKEKLV